MGKAQSKCDAEVAQKRFPKALGGMYQEQVQALETGKVQLEPPGDIELSASEGVYNLGN